MSLLEFSLVSLDHCLLLNNRLLVTGDLDLQGLLSLARGLFALLSGVDHLLAILHVLMLDLQVLLGSVEPVDEFHLLGNELRGTILDLSLGTLSGKDSLAQFLLLSGIAGAGLFDIVLGRVLDVNLLPQ